MWSFLVPIVLTAQGALAPAEPPPGPVVACTPAELRVASSLRRSRVERTLPAETFASEIAALGQAVLRPCLDTLERERVAAVAPGDTEQMLSVPQRGMVLAALAELPPAAVLSAALERAELSREDATRRLVLDVLGVAGGPQHLLELVAQTLPDDGSEPAPEVVASFQAGLAGILVREPRAYEALRSFHRDAPAALSDAIVMAVGDAGSTRGLSHLEHVLTFQPESTGLCASQVRRLGRSSDLEVDRALAQRLRWAVDADRPEDCRALLLALGELRDYEAVPMLIELLESDDRGIAGNAHWALQRITELKFAAQPERWRAWHEAELAWFAREEDAVLRALHVGSPSAAAAAAREIGERRLWREDLAQELLTALGRPQPALRSPICRAIQRLGVDNVTGGLVDLLDSDPESAQAAWRALVALTGRELPADAMTWRLALARDS